MAATTTITRQNTPLGGVAPANGAARFEDGAGTVLALAEPYRGSKADSAWRHRILSPAGNELGVLTLMTVPTGWTDIRNEATQFLLNQNVGSLKAPSAGVLLQLHAPLAPELGDILAAACVDFSVLPRGYIA